MMFDNNVIYWKTKKQPTTAQSSTEAEYLAFMMCVKDTMAMRYMLVGLRMKVDRPTVIYEDNRACIDLINNAKFFGRTSHMAPKFHLSRELITKNDIAVSHIVSADQVADALTKALPRDQFERLRNKLGVKEW